MRKNTILAAMIYLIITMAAFVAYAENVPISIDMTEAATTITGPDTLKITHLALPGIDGTFWVDFQWDNMNYTFVCIAYGKEVANCNVQFCGQVDNYKNGYGNPSADRITVTCIQGPSGATVSNQMNGEYVVTGTSMSLT